MSETKQMPIIFASNVGAILGLNPYRTADDELRAMVRRHHGAESEIKENPAKEWGIASEAEAIFSYELESGFSVVKPELDLFEGWLGAKSDGLLGDRGSLEIKCPYHLREAEKPVFKHIFDMPHYWAQVQIEMLCHDRHFTEFYQWTPNGQDLVRVGRDREWINEALLRLLVFKDKLYSEIDNKIHLEPKRPVIKSKEALMILRQIDDLDEAIDLSKERRGHLMAQLIEMADDRNVLIGDRMLTKISKAGAISYAKMVKRLRPNLTSDYMDKFRGKPSSYWKLS